MTPVIRHYLPFIRANTDFYAAYYKASRLDPYIRGFNMAKAKRDWEMLAAVYRFERQKELGVKRHD